MFMFNVCIKTRRKGRENVSEIAICFELPFLRSPPAQKGKKKTERKKEKKESERKMCCKFFLPSMVNVP